MKLQLQLIGDPYRDLGKQTVRWFGQGGGSVGRARDCFWVLPDPKCYLSGHHCEFEFRDGDFWVRDTSRNGVFLNDDKQPVGYGHSSRLKDGDRMTLGTYKVSVTIKHIDHHEIRDARGHLADVGEAGQTPHCESCAPAGDGTDADPTSEPYGVSSQGVADRVDSGRAGLAVEFPAVWATSTQVINESSSPKESQRIVKVDVEALRNVGLVPPQEQERLIANQFRKIKRPVIANAFGKGGADASRNGHLVMVTSSFPGEGKTFSSVNLALSLAREKDLQVLLVDADVAKPNVSTVFGIQNEPGLLDALADDALDIESLVFRTDVDRLSILGAGRCEADTATELLSSVRMQGIAAQIAKRNRRRVVVFDSPPLLLTNESQVLATIVGQVVLVVKAGFTSRAALLEAISHIGEATPIGLVLNQSKVGAHAGYFGYGTYGYGYGSYGYAYGDQRDPGAPSAK